MTRSPTPLMLGAIAAAVLVVYTPVWEFDFIRGDDGTYVNDRVLEGLSLSNLAWSFTTFQSSNWHPLTWWSLMLDAEIGGGGPAMFHVTNLALHLLNSMLLFAVLQAMTAWRRAEPRRRPAVRRASAARGVGRLDL